MNNPMWGPKYRPGAIAWTTGLVSVIALIITL